VLLLRSVATPCSSWRSGTLPSSLFSLSKLRRLEIRDAELSGTVPADLSGLGKLDRLDVRENSKLSGTVPWAVDSDCEILRMADTAVSGTIPSALVQLLTSQLDVANSRVSGTLPAQARRARARTHAQPRRTPARCPAPRHAMSRVCRGRQAGGRWTSCTRTRRSSRARCPPRWCRRRARAAPWT
jgi:hypothetical protein